jgi:hypothetical protein
VLLDVSVSRWGRLGHGTALGCEMWLWWRLVDSGHGCCVVLAGVEMQSVVFDSGSAMSNQRLLYVDQCVL